MKKILFLAVTLVGTVVALNAQNYKLGAFIEPSVSWYDVESRDVVSEGSFGNFSGGISVDYFFGDNYAFATGLALGTNKGSLQYKESFVLRAYDDIAEVPGGATVNYKVNTLTVPMGLKLKTNEIGYLTYFVDLGLTANINMGTKASVDSLVTFAGEQNPESINDARINKEIIPVSLAYHMGAGLEYGLSESTALFVGIYYRNFFTTLTKNLDNTYPKIVAFRVGVLF